MFYIAIKGYKSNNRYGGTSTLICGFIYLILAFYNIFVGFLLYPYTGFMIWWIGIILSIYLCFAVIIKNVKHKIESEESLPKNNSKLRKFVILMTQENPYKESISFKMEVIRKSFHLAGILFILAYFGFFFLFPLTRIVNDTVIVSIKESEWLYKILWGDIQDYPYKRGDFQAVIDLTMFALIAVLILAIVSDIIRILWGPEYSIYNFVSKAILREKEYNAFGAHIYLITGIVLVYWLYVIGLFNILMVVAGVLTSCFSDALAALIGRKYGKHKVKCYNGDTKSVEGFIAGTISAFIICLIILGPIYAFIAALVFLILDFFPISIADNILNPIIITLSLSVFSLFLGIPIGWF